MNLLSLAFLAFAGLMRAAFAGKVKLIICIHSSKDLFISSTLPGIKLSCKITYLDGSKLVHSQHMCQWQIDIKIPLKRAGQRILYCELSLHCDQFN